MTATRLNPNPTIESGWIVERYTNGYCRVSKRVQVTINATTAWHSLYYGVIDEQDLPVTFDMQVLPTVHVSLATGSLWTVGCGVSSNGKKTDKVYAVGPSSISNHNTSACYTVFGKLA